MSNDIIFSNSFNFNVLQFQSYKYTDNRKGTNVHYFAYMLSGSCNINTDRESISINEGDVFYIPNGCRYQSYWYGDPEIRFISLGFAFMPNFENKYYSVQVIEADDETKRLFLDISECDRMNAETVGRFYTLVGRLIPTMVHTKRSKQAELVEAVKRSVAIDPYSSVTELAKRNAVSESALYMAFQKHSEVSLGEFKSQVLMERAKTLLVSCDLSIEEISEKLNFSSSAYFRKCFKKHYGITPRDMRKNHGI